MEQLYSLFTVIITPLFNVSVLFLILKRKTSLPLTIGFLAACFILGLIISFTSFYERFPLLYAMLAIPLILWAILCFEGGFWQKYFVNLCVVNNSVLIGFIVSPIAQIISPLGSDLFYLCQIIFMSVFYAAELTLIYRRMRNFFPKLFELKGKIWILFSAGAIVARLILRLTVPQDSILAVTSLPQVGRGDLFDYYIVILASVWCCVSVILTIVFTRRRIIDSEELQNSRTALEAAKVHYSELFDSLEEAAALRHDIKYQLSAISELAGKKDWEGIAGLLSQTQSKINPPMHFCGNGVADALLCWYAKRMKTEGIDFKAEVVIPADIAVDSADLCVLLGNLLENARLAASPLAPNAYVHIRAKTEPNMFVLEVENNYSGKLQKKDGKLVSTKENGGQGQKSVALICSKYNGEFIPSFTDDKFTALVLLNK